MAAETIEMATRQDAAHPGEPAKKELGWLGSRIVRGLRDFPEAVQEAKAGSAYDDAIDLAKAAKDPSKVLIAQRDKDAAVEKFARRLRRWKNLTIPCLLAGWLWLVLGCVVLVAVLWRVLDAKKFADSELVERAAWFAGIGAGIQVATYVAGMTPGMPWAVNFWSLSWPVLAVLVWLIRIIIWVGPDETAVDNIAAMAPADVERDAQPNIVSAVLTTKALPQDTEPVLVFPGIQPGNDGAIWTATVDTMGPSAEALLPAKPRAELASRLGLSTRRLILTVDEDRGSRLHLTGIVGQPWRAGSSPLLTLTPVNLWDGIPWGPTIEGDVVNWRVFERNALLGGESGAGKSTAMAGIWTAFALAVWEGVASKLFIIDGGDVDTRPLHDTGLATRWTTELPAGIDILTEVRDEVNRRQKLLGDAKLRKANPAFFVDNGISFDLCLIDEVATFTQRKGQEASDFSDLMREVAQRCRKVGIHLVLGTQSPSVDAIDADARDVLPVRWLGRARSVDLGNKVLGKGASGRGLSPATLPNTEDTRGVGWYSAPGREVQNRPYDWTDAQLESICRRGVELRRGLTRSNAATEDRNLMTRAVHLIRVEGVDVAGRRVMRARDVAARLEVEQMELRRILADLGVGTQVVRRADSAADDNRAHYVLADFPGVRAVG